MPHSHAILLPLTLGLSVVGHADADALRDAFTSSDPPRSIGPLMWYHGEDDSLILDEIDHMHEGGMGNFTIESRPHPDYLGPKWWHDIGISLERAKQLGMQVWIFDEKWFPSGLAGGLVQAADHRFWRHFVTETSAHVKGPSTNFGMDLPESEQVVGAVAVPTSPEPETMVDVREHVAADGRRLAFAVPEGEWDVFVYTLHSDPGHNDVINIDATRKFIELVHEPTYEHFAPYFGNVIQGFFMDEPGFFNGGDQTPWTYDFAEGFAADKGYDLRAYLPALTHPSWASYRWVRYDYMDYLTRRYADAFYKPIQDWCHAHGVKSIGHMYEHELTHWSLGAGTGHLFRMERYFDMGGIDVVFHQVIEGSSNIDYWGMPKLASSIAHVYDMDDHVAMDETYGASGWTTGLKRMKWLADWQAVRGINFLVPHAFNPQYPDPDCPPFFYARGNNPQWPMFRQWADYTNRVCYMLTGGKHIAPAAVLYTAESHWAGEADLVEWTEAELIKAQVDFDLVPYDVFLSDACRLQGGKMRLHDEEYSLLVLPGVEALPVAVAERIERFARDGGTVLTSRFVPEFSCERGGDGRVRDAMRAVFGEPPADAILWQNRSHGGAGLFARRVAYLPHLLERSGVESDLALYPRSADVRYIHRVKDGHGVFLITTESVGATYEGTVSLEADGVPEIWDAMAGTTTPARVFERDGNRVLMPLKLAPYQSVLVVFAPGEPSLHIARTNLDGILSAERAGDQVRVTGWMAEPGLRRACALAQDGESWWSGKAAAPPMPPARELPADGWRIQRGGRTYTGSVGDWAKEDPNYSGSAEYEVTFDVGREEIVGRRITLDLGEVGEIARLWLNGQPVASLICPPYKADISETIRAGANTLRVEVTNTLANRRVAEGEPALYAEVMPSGLIGPVRLVYRPEVTLVLRPTDRVPERRLPSRDLPPLQAGQSLAATGATVKASSTLSAGFPAEAVIDGDVTGTAWEQGGGWNDATPEQWGDWLQVSFPSPRAVGRVVVCTLADDYRNTSEIDPDMRFTKYGIIDFDVQVWQDQAWRTVAEVRGNDRVRSDLAFPPVTTDRIRVVVHGALSDFSRIVEVEAHPG